MPRFERHPDMAWSLELDTGVLSNNPLLDELWRTDAGKVITQWSNLPVKMGGSSNYNYNSRYADNLRVIIRRGVPGQSVNPMTVLVDTNPDIIPGTGDTPGTPSCFIVEYDLLYQPDNDLEVEGLSSIEMHS